MTYKCVALERNPKNVILFGLVVPIERKAPTRLDLYCQAIDEHGTTYDIYTDYDPCLGISETVAIKKGE